MKNSNLIVIYFFFLILAGSCSSSSRNQDTDDLRKNDSILNVQVKALIDSTLSQHIGLKLDSFNISNSIRNNDTLKSISGKGYSKLYKEKFEVEGIYRAGQNLHSCISLEVNHRHIGNVFTIYDTIVSKQVDTLTFSQQLHDYYERLHEIWEERENLSENAYANRTKVHFGISQEEYNKLGEDFQRNFYEGLVGYGAYELAEPIFMRGEFSGFEIMEIHDKTFSYYNVQNNAELVRQKQIGYNAHECFIYVYVCELYNMEIMSRYDKFDRKTKKSLKVYWNEWGRLYY